MLKRLDDIAQAFLAITVWVALPKFAGHVRDCQKRRSFEQYYLLCACFFGQIVQIPIYDMQIRNQRLHNISPCLIETLIPYRRAIHLQFFAKNPAVLLDSESAILNH